MKIATLGELLRQRAFEKRAAIAYAALDDSASLREMVSYGQLHRAALRVAGALQRRFERRSRIVLAYPNGIEFITAFFGCALSGMIAVPVAPPKRNRKNERFKAILRDALPACVLTQQGWEDLLRTGIRDAGQSCEVYSIEADEFTGGDAREHGAEPDDIAYLQYTSGSIGAPKGVIVTHASVLSNSAFMQYVEENDQQSVSLTWLPNFHDMGLAEGLLQPMFSGIPGLIMTPAAFLARPRLWLEAISSHRVTNSGGPNFAYDLCIEKAGGPGATPLDLSYWRVAYNGAEPIRHHTLKRFLETFAPFGFKEQAFYPVYGLAEATLLVTSGRRQDLPFHLTVDRENLERGQAVPVPEGADNSYTLVASGLVLSGRHEHALEVVIVDPASGDPLCDGAIGEVDMRGPGVALGYWNRPQETEETFAVTVRGREDVKFARTGDLGFIWEGRLFLTGRMKDLIITKGRNLYPHDIEWLAETAHEAIRPSGSAAFSPSAAQEDRIVVVCEVTRKYLRRDLRGAAEAVRERVSTELEIELDDVVLIAPGALPKTSSGKVQRLLCRDMLKRGEFAVIFSAPKANTAPVEAAGGLRAELTALLQRGQEPGPIPDDTPIFQYVNDSLHAVQLCHEVERRYGVAIPVSCFFGRSSLPDLMNAITSRRAGAQSQELVLNAEPSGLVRLSYGQEALWFLSAVAPDSVAYHISRVLEITGPLDVTALRRALDLLPARHAALRTRFEIVDGVPQQAFNSSKTISFECVDGLGRDVARYLSEQAWPPFNLESDSLVRFHLLSRGDQRHLLLISIHHIVADLGSFAQLLDELLGHYEALVSGQWPHTPAPAHDYADFVRWQRQMRSSAEGRAMSDLWKERVRGLPPETALPLDRSRPARQSFRGAWIEHDLDDVITARLERFAQDAGATPFCVLLATYLVFLHRATGQAAVTVGVPVSGRQRRQFAGTLGFVANAIVIASEISRATSWRDVLLRTSAQLGSALDAGDYPFPLVVEDSGVERDPRFSPLFQQMFSLESSLEFEELAPLTLGRSGGHLERANLTLTSFALPQQGAQFDLHAMFARHHGRLLGNWNFNSDLLDEDTVRRWAGAYTNLLRESLDHPDRAVAELSACGSEDCGLQGEPMDLPAGVTLHGLIEKQARQNPDRIALSFDNQFLTYQKLERDAGAIARALRRRGVGIDDRVGVCLDRSLELPVVLLGILKSGAAYLPIATDYPRKRIEQLLADARPVLVITSNDHRDKFGGIAVMLSELLQAGHEGSRATAPADWSGSAAYVIFTSGSTGSPKGAVNSHRGIANRLLWMQREYGLKPDDHVLQKTPYTFDVSVWEFFWPLLSGAQLILCEPGAHRDPLYLRRLIAEREITVLHFVPSMLALFSEQADRASVISVREVFSSGEVLPKAVETAALGLFGGAIHNLYGPTEAAVDVTAWRCSPEDRGAIAPIGRPIANITIRILDGRMRPVIPGAAGNLYIAGLGLARGYIGRPDLTASSFVPDPYADQPSSRLYATGDRARTRGDLAIEFLGRGDFQVKVRGFRVELPDIEAQLHAHPGVASVAVIARDDGQFGTRLTAYYAVRKGSFENGRTLRTWLAERLPDYMIPAFFIELAALPLLESGKVDRKALPLPTGIEAPETGVIAPRTSDELALAEVWKEVLGIESISVTHTFFELGGDSLLIVRAAAKAKERGLNVTAELIYQYQTIEKICAQARGAAPSVDEQPPYTAFSLIDPAEAQRLPGGLQDAMPLARLQETLVYHIENYENYIAYVASVHLRAPFRLELWEQAIDAALARHPYLRTSFALKDFQDPLQFVHAAAPRPLYLNDLRQLSADAQEQYFDRWLASEKKRRFEWDTAPFFRITLHRRTEDTFELTLTEVMLDGWSMAVVLAELCRSYRSLLQGQPLEAHAEDPSYGRFVQLERAAAKNPASEEFWRKTLAVEGAAALPRWPARWRSADRSLHSRRTVHIAAGVVERLKECAREAGCPLKSVFLAAHLAVLRTLTGRNEVLTELIIHGRPEEAGGDSAVGIYINTVPVQAGLGGMSWIDLIRQAARSEAELYPHRRYPFFEIRRMSGHPLLDEAAFNFTHFYTHKDLLPGDGYLEVLVVQAFDQTYFNLTAYFNLLPVDQRLSIDLDYNPTELADEQIALAAGYYEKALLAIAAAPASKLAETPLMSAPELTRELNEWSVAQPLTAEPPELLDVIYHYCRKSPDRVAIVQDDVTLTYGELRRRAAALSARLVELGIGPEVGVGVLLERSPEFVIALMAVLESGGFFVPLDPCDPDERKALLVRQSGVRAIIVKTIGANLGDVVEVCCEEAGAAAPQAAIPQHPPGALAYCIYTSGSTGEPKGVQVPRSALASFIPAAAAAYKLDDGDGVLQFAALCFDVAVEEIFCTLWTGGRLILRTAETLDSFDAFLDACARDQLTFLDLSTAFWHQLSSVLKEGHTRLPPVVKTVVTVGEKAIARRLADWREAVGTGVQVYNAYGPTEATIVSVLHRVEADGPVEEEFPIGRPVAGMSAFILGADDEAGPVGRIGQLCLGGRGLARGYRGRGDLTAERFRPNPFGPEPGSRLYWTGDFVKRRPDGAIDFIGRKDAQIKLRGFRIELGEIESALYADERVKQAAVVASHPDDDATPVLVAYVTPKQWTAESAGQLAEQLSSELRRKLPAYMVPARIEVTPSFALTRSGKVNKSGLSPAPAAAAQPAGVMNPSPQGPIEAALCAIYRGCLGIEEVPRTARFADLGGHSLSAMKIVSRIQEKLHVHLKVRDIFDAPGIQALAERLEQAQRLNGGRAGHGEPIRRATPDQKLEMSFAQERLWFLHQFDTASTSYNVPAAFWIRGPLNAAALHQAFAEICRRHQVLQTRFVDRGASAEPVLPSRFTLPLTHIDLKPLNPSERKTMAKQIGLREAARAFDLKNDNLIRITLVELEAEEFLLVVVMHHIVTDEWCAEIFMDEFRRFYEAAIEGVPPRMPELPIQYSDFARWQKTVVSGERLAMLQQFWRRELAGAPPVLQLPTDAPRERAGHSRSGRLYFEIERRVTEGLRSRGETQDASLFMVLLALYQALLHSVSDMEDIVVGSPIAGRVSPDTEKLVGFFANLLVLRARICPSASFPSHLAEVRETALSCYDHQELSFAQLVAAINPERSSWYAPIVQVIFGMWPQSLREMCAGGLRLEQEQIYPQQAKYDLEMQIADGGEVLRGFLEYNAALFRQETIAELVAAYRRLCEAVVHHPAATLSELRQNVREQMVCHE